MHAVSWLSVPLSATCVRLVFLRCENIVSDRFVRLYLRVLVFVRLLFVVLRPLRCVRAVLRPGVVPLCDHVNILHFGGAFFYLSIYLSW